MLTQILLFFTVQGVLTSPISTVSPSGHMNELHIQNNRLALIQRDSENRSILHCQLFGTRVMLKDLLAALDDVTIFDYAGNESALSPADFHSILTQCEHIQINQVNEMRRHVELEREVNRKLKTETRVKRSSRAPVFEILFGIYPGTKWCGLGNIADDEELGKLSGLDACCKQHDRCPTDIAAFTTDPLTRLYNAAVYTKSHCDCDARFKTCLKEANSQDADYVGTIFFDLLESQCFKLDHPMECIDGSWWGFGCYEYRKNMDKPKEWYFTDEITYSA